MQLTPWSPLRPRTVGDLRQHCGVELALTGIFRLLARSIVYCPILTKHLDTRRTGFVYADADPRMAIGIGDHEMRVFVLVGQRDSLNALRGSDGPGLERTPIVNV